jgi:hypothetical protein
MADHLLPISRPHRGDPEPRRMALAAIGFQWRAGLWRRGRVVRSDADIDAMDAMMDTLPPPLDTHADVPVPMGAARERRS